MRKLSHRRPAACGLPQSVSRSADTGGTDLLAGILLPLPVYSSHRSDGWPRAHPVPCCFILRRVPACGIFCAVLLLDKGTCCRIGLLADSCRIGTQIGNQSDRSLSLYFHALVELLRQTHRLLRGEVQHLRCFLLQGTRGERKRRFLGTLSFFTSDTVKVSFSSPFKISSSCSFVSTAIFSLPLPWNLRRAVSSRPEFSDLLPVSSILSE